MIDGRRQTSDGQTSDLRTFRVKPRPSFAARRHHFSPRRGAFRGTIFRTSYGVIVLLWFVVPPLAGWQRNWIRREPKATENPVTCFPVEEGGAAGTKGGSERSELSAA